MAEFKIALGASADVVSGEELKSAVTGLRGHIDKRLSGSRFRPVRKLVTQATTVNLSTGQTATLALGRPAMGKIWSLASITILGADDGTTVAGLKAAIYVGDEVAVSLSQCVVPQQSIPFFDTYGFPDIWIHDQNKLYLNLTASGSVANQVVVGNAWVMEYNDDAVEMQYI